MCTGETNDRVFLDPDTWLETLLALAGWLCGIIAVSCLMVLWSGHVGLISGVWMLLFVTLSVTCYKLRRALDDFYIVDFATQEVLFGRTFNQTTTNKKIFTFDQVAGLVMMAKINPSSKHRTKYWTYALALYPKKGRPVIVRSHAAEAHSCYAIEGREIAKRMGIEFFDGGRESIPRVWRGTEGLKVKWRNYYELELLLKGLMPLVIPGAVLIGLIKLWVWL